MIVPNLLVTDDDTAFRGVLRDALVRRGFSVTEASDGKEAIDVIGNSRVHMALVDVHMPRMTGLEVMEHLLESPESPPCVLMSAQWDEESRQQAAKLHAYGVLAKPFRLELLRDVVGSALADVYGWHPYEGRS